jgi:predicted XRE-type DNA-binding protein
MSKRNIFAAMGFEPEDAMIYAIRTDLADAIAAYLRDEQIRQVDAAEQLGLSQAAVSNINRGHIDHLSIERLMKAMVRAGLPGYAKWPSAENARAGLLPMASAASTVSADVKFEEPYEQQWLLVDSVDFDAGVGAH